MKALINAIVSIALVSTVASALEFKATPVSPHAAIEQGQLWRWKFAQAEKTHQWVTRFGVWAGYQLMDESEKIKINMGLGGLLWFSLPEDPENPGTLSPKFLPDIPQVNIDWLALGEAKAPTLQLTMGYFGYKYNPDAHNLGEYLFRSRAYPGFVYTGGWMTVDRNPGARLLGIKATNTLFDGNLKNDFIINSDINSPPNYDFSFSYIGSYNFHKILDVGFGLNLYHYLPVDEKKSDRKVGINNSGVTNAYIKGPGDTAYYNFKAIKLMGRATIDPKPIFGSPEIFSPEDLRLFVEVAVLGLQNYGSDFDTTNLYNNLYSTRKERIPVMFGFNLPTFHFLDLLSFQMEYYPFPFVENEYDMVKNTLPIPLLIPGVTAGTPQDPYKKDDWKWSLFFSKQVFNAIGLSGQVARDHYRTQNNGIRTEDFSVITEPKHWYYMLRVDLGF